MTYFLRFDKFDLRVRFLHCATSPTRKTSTVASNKGAQEMKLPDNLEIFAGQQHYIENFDFNKFFNHYKTLSYEGQRGFIESFDISTNPEWLQLKRGYLGASTAHDFLSDSQKVSALKRTKAWAEMSMADKKAKLAEIPLEERLGEACKKLAYRILAERRTSWTEPEPTWAEKTSIKRGLIFEKPAVEIYKKIEGLTDENLADVLFIRNGDLMGFSPDKLVLNGDKRIVLEIKNFEAPAFYKAVADAEKPETIEQVQWQIHVGNLNRVDVLYCSQEDGTYKLVRYGRGIEYMNALSIREEEFREYLTILENKIKSEVIDINL